MMFHEHTVLVVEDDVVIVPMFTEILKYAFDTIVAGSLAEARKMLRIHDIAATLLDLSLPNGEGKEVVHKLREEFPEIPLVCISAYDFTAEEMILAGAHDFIRKPSSAFEILDKVTNTIARNKAWEKIAPLQHIITG